ncbi:putative DNA-invertase from lambdoid prophage Rac [mine drainage metagenome]|uniref:Putative DNA-invertase from lambdoid prophage Rac n=1 Tax=mine drainage metagenome TaxID=410659 RepID=A0A1J5RPN6_9ZZZZ
MRYFIYCRKSTESEDRQVLSIDSQLKELQSKFSSDPSVEVAEIYREAFSAKAPGRPIFDEMIRRIEQGQADGIIAWHPDRLARNSVDGGRIIHLLDRNRLKDLKFATSSFENNPQGKFMLQIIFGYSKYYVDSLSENVKRGMRAKLERGWKPNKPPTGYKNEQELQTIVSDAETFPIMKKLFERAVTGSYTIAELERMLRMQWGFRTPKRKRTGGRPLSLASLYRIFSNPFYAGYIRWNGQLYPGKHEPMITWKEFERLQAVLGRPGAEKPQKHRFAYTGLIRCGTCGLMVTAEHKTNRFGSKYVYYHCTRRNIGTRCKERSIEVRELERQIAERLHDIYVPPKVVECAIRTIEKRSLTVEESVEFQRASLEKAIRGCDEKLKTLIDLRLRGLIDDQELVSRREEMQKEKIALTEEHSGLDRQARWFEPVMAVVSFGSRAAAWFMAGDDALRKMILKTIGSNLTLRDGKLNIEAAFPYSLQPDSASFLSLCGLVSDVRTLYINRDPKLLELIQEVERIEKMVPESLKLAA